MLSSPSPNCAQSAAGVAAFYTDYFACTDIWATTDGTTLSTDGLPPHPSAYYPTVETRTPSAWMNTILSAVLINRAHAGK
jgi:hypothetical protein